MGGAISAGVLAGACAPGGTWMLLKLVVGGAPDGPESGPGVKPIPGAGLGPWSWWGYESSPPLKEPP